MSWLVKDQMAAQSMRAAGSALRGQERGSARVGDSTEPIGPPLLRDQDAAACDLSCSSSSRPM